MHRRRQRNTKRVHESVLQHVKTFLFSPSIIHCLCCKLRVLRDEVSSHIRRTTNEGRLGKQHATSARKSTFDVCSGRHAFAHCCLIVSVHRAKQVKLVQAGQALPASSLQSVRQCLPERSLSVCSCEGRETWSARVTRPLVVTELGDRTAAGWNWRNCA